MSPTSIPENTWIVIAAYNESAVIGEVVRELTTLKYLVVVVDDGSTDGTVDALKGSGATVIQHPVNLGQGAALQTGMSYALAEGAHYVVTFDADGQHSAQDIPRLISALDDGNAQVALGTRFAKGGEAVGIPLLRKVLLRCAVIYTRILIGLHVSDTHNGLRAFTAEAAKKIRITQNRMAHATQILRHIAVLKIPFVEVPVTICYTEHSLHKGQRLSNAFNIMWETLEGMFDL